MTRSRNGEGSINPAGPGRWQIRWSEGADPFTGEHIRRSATIDAKNKTEAQRVLRAITVRRARTVPLSRMTVGQLIEWTLPALPNTTERTRATYEFALRSFPPAAREWEAADLSIVQARQVMDGLKKRCGAQTVRKIHGALMSCWREAKLNGWVDHNPWQGQHLPPVPATAGTVLADAEVAALKAACDDELERLWIDLHLSTGARPGEVTGLRWSAIDLDDAVLTFTDAKHGGRARPVAVPASTVERIRSWQVKQRERALAAGGGIDPDPYLISNEADSSVPWRVAYAGSYRWQRLRKRAGLRDGLRLYDCRHTHNSWLAADGMDSTTRAQRIGNSPATNERTYSHSIRDREAAAAVALRMG